MGYTAKEQLSPAMVYFVGLALVTVAGALGLQGESHVTRGLDIMFTSKSVLSHTPGMVCAGTAHPSFHAGMVWVSHNTNNAADSVSW